MAPKSPWKTNNKKSAIPAPTAKPAAVSVAETNAINYVEVQDDEIAVLQAIYMDDYEALEVKGAWSKTADRSFKLRLRSLDDPGTNVVLSVRLTATYPRTIPLLDVQGLDVFHERTQKRIRNVISRKPLLLLGEVMIHAICEEIQDALEDAVMSRQQGTLPSLEEERASAEEVALTIAKETEEAEAQRLRLAQEEEDRMLKQMVNEEVHRREKRKPAKVSVEGPTAESNQPHFEIMSFDQPISINTDTGPQSFKDIMIAGMLSQDDEETRYLARPRNSTINVSPMLTIKRRKVRLDRNQLVELESILDAAHKLRHNNLLGLLAYRVVRLDNCFSEVITCQEYNDRGTLKDLLSLGSVHLDKARQWIVELLEALDYLHRSGMPHGQLSADTILLVDTTTTTPKLSEIGNSSMFGASRTSNRWTSSKENTSVASRCQDDVWNLGIVVVQMCLGLDVPSQYTSPSAMIARLNLSQPFEDLLTKIFASDGKKRSSAFDLLPTEFLRTASPVLMPTSPEAPRHHRRQSSSRLVSPIHTRRPRHDSTSIFETTSRYLSDFTEIGRLGRGGFGEVVKARNKLDGGIYAVKKIRQAPQLLDQVLSEVMLLNRLNHPYVVRYYSTWVESDVPASTHGESISTSDETRSSEPQIDFGYPSTGGLDFVSSSGMHEFEFGEDDDSDDEDGDTTDDLDDDDPFERDTDSEDDATTNSRTSTDRADGDVRLQKSRSESRRLASVMYIQMEYCERRTLRDLIHKGMDEDDSWRYVRQITEGLAHIHSHGIIHRDLKPDNVFLDVALLPKIGDFGLATTGQYHSQEKQSGSKSTSIDMTRSIGTALYTAPELRSTSGSTYNDKVDMYSLGIMFFEMNVTFGTAMERISELQHLREKDTRLPAEFQTEGEKAAQGKLIHCLISHRPSDRLSSVELLRSEILPLKIEDETIRQALSGLSDPRSPYHQKMMSALFAHDMAGSQRVKALAWEAKAPTSPEDPDRVRLRGIVRSSLETVFRRHGAEESRRDSILPRSGLYTNPNVVQLLDASGNLLQLPYDLTLPHAQQLARQPSSIRCTFAFGCAYRDAFSGGPPRVNEEADFDIICSSTGALDNDSVLDDAEILKVIDEVIASLPVSASSSGIAIYVNHGSLLDIILKHCRIPLVHQHATKETLSKLGFQQWTWPKIRSELRNIGLADTSLDDLQLFDIRDVPEKVFGRLRHLIGHEDHVLQATVVRLQQVLDVSTIFGISLKLYIAPLSCFNAKFYENGLMFQCVVERKTNRVVIAAGGRYDKLIQKCGPSQGPAATPGAIGLCIGIDQVVSHMIRNSNSGAKSSYLRNANPVQQRLPKRCEVLVIASGGGESLRDAGIKILSTLWNSEIGAELATSSISEKDYSFVVTLRHSASSTVKVNSTDGESPEADVAISSLVSYMQSEMRERAGQRSRIPLLRHHSSHQEGGKGSQHNNVQVLLARHGSKKSNKYHIVETAQQRWAEKLDSIKNHAPILAVETRDDVLELIQQTILSDTDTWRRAVQSVQLSERQYVQQVQEVLEEWKRKWTEDRETREACVFNFRTGKCIYYDLGL